LIEAKLTLAKVHRSAEPLTQNGPELDQNLALQELPVDPR
jgi:hypothetical protein